MSDQQELSVDEVYARLRAAVDRDARDPASMRGLAERFWPVSADKPLERRPGAKGWLAFQVKRVLRKLDALVRRARLRRAADRQRRAAPARRRPLAPGRRARDAGRMRLAVCMPQVPFERGGTEIFADGLVQALREHGHETELVTVPYKWYPGERVLTQAFLWRLLDLEEANGRPIDAVIATKFPSYVVRHPRKVVWLLHQFRQAWDLDRTELGQFSESAEDRALRRKVLELDRVALGEARKIFTTSSIVAGRLHDSTGLDAEVLAPPPAPLDFHCDARTRTSSSPSTGSTARSGSTC